MSCDTPVIDRSSLPHLVPTSNLDLDITSSCNLGCVYCFKNELNGTNMSLDQAKKSFQWFLEASGAVPELNVNFMGGEPTINWKLIREFVPWAKRRGRASGKSISFSMTSNLTLWTEEIRKFVDAHGFGILMSIDGCPDVQDAQRPSKNGHRWSDTVAKWARSMLQTRPRATARMTIHPKYVHRLFDSILYLRELGFAEISIASASYSEWSESHFSILSTEMNRAVDFFASEYANGRPICLTVVKHYAKRLVIPRLDGLAVAVSRQPCGAGKGYLMVDQEGDIWPCHRFDGADEDVKGDKQFSLGNISRPGFKHDLQRVFLDLDHLKNHKDRCTTCPVNEICGGFCPAANLSATGSLYTPHDAFCDWSLQMYRSAESLVDRLRGDPDAWQCFLSSLEGVESDGQR